MSRTDRITRRRFLELGGIATLALSVPGLVGAAPALPDAGRGRHRDLLRLTATEATVRLQHGEFTAEDYAIALLDQAEKLRSLDTIISIDPDAVIAAAKAVDEQRRRGRHLGPLAGLPLIIKDNVDTVALPTTAGTPGLLNNRPRENAPILGPLFAAGATLFAKANMHELAFGITSHNYYFGAVHNPYNPALIPGGSSGGTAAAIAARIVPAGLGTDTGGSCRIPAALCGVAGFRPTVGRYPKRRIVPISHTRDTPGPLGRTVADVALLDSVITGSHMPEATRGLAGVRLGVPRDPFWSGLDSEVAAVMTHALERLRHLGVVLVEADIPQAAALDAQIGFPIALYEANKDIPAYLAAEGNGITFDYVASHIASPDVAAAIAAARSGVITEAVYLQALHVGRPQLQQAYAEYFSANRVQAMLFPTTVLPARPIGQDSTVELNGQQVPTFLTYIRNTDADACAGIPGLSIPAGLTASGLPVGLELDAPAGADASLLALGLALEREAFRPLPAPALAGV